MIEVGKRLFTKDGRRVGNGIVTDVDKMALGKLTQVDVYSVTTDFGNKMRCTKLELEEFYHLDWEPEPGPYEHGLEEWMATRRRLILEEEPQS